MRLPTGPSRPGFTLVEVLVAAALCILIMTVLAYAFQQGMDTWSLMKSTGELQERLNAAEQVLKRDLDNIGLELSDPALLPRVSSVRLDQVAAVPAPPRPTAGFFRIEWANNGTREGVDPDGIGSTRAVGHRLRMSVRLPARKADELFITRWTGALAHANLQVPRNQAHLLPARVDTFASPWADVYYFLAPSFPPTFTAPNPNTGVAEPLYTLHRQVRVVLPEPRNAVTIDPPAAAAEQQAVSNDGTTILGPDDLAIVRPLPTSPLTSLQPYTVTGTDGGVRSGEDVLVTGVLSFEIKAIWTGTEPQFPNTKTTPDSPFAEPVAPKVFDTAGPITGGGDMPVQLQAIQIKLRIYDAKNKLARQITITKDL
jgi:type II secretory pathway pseudopilin PulG